MKRALLCVVVVLGLASPVRAAWISGTVAALEAAPDGRTIVVVVFSDDKGQQDKMSFIEDLSAVRGRIVLELARRNASDVAKVDVQVGTVVTVPGVTPPPMPTDDDLAVAALQVALVSWRTQGVRLVLGVGEQGDVETALATVQTLYKAGTKTQQTRFDALLFFYANQRGMF